MAVLQFFQFPVLLLMDIWVVSRFGNYEYKCRVYSHIHISQVFVWIFVLNSLE